ncbi:MAG TPA: glutamate--tRNA ligase [Candidatus Xenobia bacterium]|jgi:glutamyl-tRNA synthetase
MRVRFAPSPTGYLHVGGLRTALYNYLLARRQGGTFILRIEDTDRTRYVEGAVDNLMATLRWAGLEFDEGPGAGGQVGPYVQSERLDLYRKYAGELQAGGYAYPCFCSPERLTEMRKAQEKAGESPKYDRHCLTLSPDERQARASEPHVVRLKVPDGETVTFTDQVRGEVSFDTNTVDDQVLMKSDGYPTYHLANVVDDHLMGITHVVRGEEWVSSTPKHILLYRAFGWEAPHFAHLPLLLNPDKSKLSKRQGDVAVEDYRAKGYLAEALVNFVALLGWNSGTEQEIFSKAELIQAFSLDRVNKSGAVFDINKLNWLNEQYIHKLPVEGMLPMVRCWVEKEGYAVPDDATLAAYMTLMKERVTLVSDFATNARYLFVDPTSYDEDAVKKRWKDGARELVADLQEPLAALPVWDAPALEAAVRTLAESKGVNASKIIHPLRLAVSGSSAGPGLFELLAVLGKERVERRLQAALKSLP